MFSRVIRTLFARTRQSCFGERELVGQFKATVFVTGASGDLAMSVMRRFTDIRYKVCGTMRSLSDEFKVASLKTLFLALELSEADLLTGLEPLEKAMEGCIYHSAENKFERSRFEFDFCRCGNYIFERFEFLVCSKFNHTQCGHTRACAVACLCPHISISNVVVSVTTCLYIYKYFIDLEICEPYTNMYLYMYMHMYFYVQVYIYIP